MRFNKKASVKRGFFKYSRSTDQIIPTQFIHMKEPEINSKEKDSRRSVLFGIGILSLLPLLKIGNIFSKKSNVISCAPETEKRTVKMLTEDGRLVEVEVSKMEGASKEKISQKDLLVFVKK